MPYELPGLPPRNESPGQFAWEVIESPAAREKRGRATHYSPIGFSECVAWKAIFKRWMPRVCSLIHVESTSRSLSHPLQLQFLQARLMAVEKVVEGGGSGALVFMGKWPIPTLCGNPESLRWGRENKVDVEFGINCSFTIVSEKCPGTAVRCTCHTLSTCANWMRRGFIFRLRHICISPVNVTITRQHPTKVLSFLLTFWFFLFLAAAVDILLLICMFGTPLSHPTTMIICIFILMPRSCPTAGNIWKTYHNTFFLKKKRKKNGKLGYQKMINFLLQSRWQCAPRTNFTLICTPTAKL